MKIFNKKIYISIFLIVFILGFSTQINIAKSSDVEIILHINQKNIIINSDGNEGKYTLDISPEIIEGTTFIPIRGLFDKLGGKVKWNEKLKQIEISKDGTYIILKPNSSIAVVNNKEVKIPKEVVIINNRSLLPLRFVSEQLGYIVKWIGEEQKIIIYSNESKYVSKNLLEKVYKDYKFYKNTLRYYYSNSSDKVNHFNILFNDGVLSKYPHSRILAMTDNDIYFIKSVEINKDQKKSKIESKGFYRINNNGENEVHLDDTSVVVVYIDDNYMYYAKSKNYGESISLYKVSHNSRTPRIILNNVDIENINITNEYILYKDAGTQKIYKVNADGRSNKKIINTEVKYYEVDGEWIYYIDNNDLLYKSNINGNDTYQISEDKLRYLKVFENYIYYLNVSDNFKMYRAKKDGTEKTLINEELLPLKVKLVINSIKSLDLTEDIEYKKTKEYTYYKGVKYFIDKNYDNRLYKYEKENGELTSLTDTNVYEFEILNDWIFYTNSKEEKNISFGHISDFSIPKKGLYKMKLDGTENKKINNDTVDDIRVSENWVYYKTKYPDNKLYRINTDSKKSESIASNVSNFCLEGDIVYYINNDYSRGKIKFYTVELHNKKSKKIHEVSGQIYQFFVYDGWIYFRDDEGLFENNMKSEYYKMKIDGTDKQTISNSEYDSIYYKVYSEF